MLVEGKNPARREKQSFRMTATPSHFPSQIRPEALETLE
jgi:hypothetical protein